MEPKDFSLVALALKTAKRRLLCKNEAGVTAIAAVHKDCAETIAGALEARFGRKFNRKSFLKEASVESEPPQAQLGPSKTCRVHCLREPYDVYIGRGRGGIWGNPFSHKNSALAEFKVATRDEAVNKHMQWLRKQDHLLAQLHTLKGKKLGCFCEKDERCHGDNIIALIEELAD